MKVTFFFLATIFLFVRASNVLGPVRACRCYTSNVATHTATEVKALGGLGPAQICHCMPSAHMNVPTSDHSLTAPGPGAPAVGMSTQTTFRAPSFLSSPSSVRIPEACGMGNEVHGKYTVDNYGNFWMCDTPLSNAGYNQEINIDLVENTYKCGHFRFAVHNEMYSSGMAFYVKQGDSTFVAVGKGSPSTLPEKTFTLKAYAKWSYGSCAGITFDESDEAVYVSSLVDTNEAFKNLQAMGAYPIGVQNGNVYKGGLQCILIVSQFCKSADTARQQALFF